jgi:1-acyl-sn-glycerol-3-phosphate acyltransferase
MGFAFPRLAEDNTPRHLERKREGPKRHPVALNLTRAMSRYELWAEIIAFSVLAVILSSPWIAAKWRAAQRKIQLVCTCGYVPDPPTSRASRAMRMVARSLVWIQVGKIEVSGMANLDCAAPKLVAPTHGHYVDPFIIALLLRERARCMAARGLLEFGGGLGALLFSPWGVFCTDLRAGKGSPALRAAVRILESGQTLVMFPEGWAHMDGAVGPFKRGAVDIARMTEAKVGRPVSIVPVHLRYGAYPGAWITRFPVPLQCLMVLLGVVFFRRGVQVAVGKPLLSSGLPKHAALATEQLRSAVMALDSCSPARSRGLSASP